MPRIDCPVPSCPGTVLTKRLEEHGVVMLCDGPAAHSDTTIRNAFVRWDEELDAIDPDSADTLLRNVDPVEFIRDQVLNSAKRTMGRVRPPSSAMLVPPPTYPTGLGGVQNGRLLHFQGLTLLSGKASSGKTWSAMRASLDAAESGWDVVYVAAEAAAVIHNRVAEVLDGSPQPEAWTLRMVEDGTPFPEVVEFMASAIRTERTLFVIDSFSTLLRMTEDDEVDYWAHHRRLERFLFNVRQLTAGCVGLLVLSEANAAGETKGRSFDHIADLSVNFAKDADDPETKCVSVVKSWWGRMGNVGNFAVRPSQGGLVRLPDPDTPNSEKPGYSYVVGGDTYGGDAF